VASQKLAVICHLSFSISGKIKPQRGLIGIASQFIGWLSLSDAYGIGLIIKNIAG